MKYTQFKVFITSITSICIYGLLTSCSLGTLLDDDLFREDPLPTVLCYESKYILDYNDCFENIYIGKDEPCLSTFQKAPLTKDMFNPYHPIDSKYRLARGDILDLSLLGEEESIVENAMVAPDGKLYYSMLDGIQAAGRRPEEVAKDLQDHLKNLFVSPLVTITPKESAALNFYVLGRVKTAGAYPFKGPVTLSEAISEAGGILTQTSKEQDYRRRYLIPYVDLEKSFIARGTKKLDVNFAKLLYEGDWNQNIYLMPEDYIYIAGSEKREVFVLGALLAPQRLPFAPGMTLMSSLATVGGWPTPSPRSPDLSHVIVIRGSLECPKVCYVDVQKILSGEARDVIIEPGDIIYASHKPFRFGRDLVLIALYSFANSFTSAAGEFYTVFDWFRKTVIDIDDVD